MLFYFWRQKKYENNSEYSLANFLILCNLLNVEQVMQSSLVVVFGQSLIQDWLGKELVSWQRDLIAGKEAALQFSHCFIRSEFHNSLTRRVPPLCSQQELLSGCHQVFQVCEWRKRGGRIYCGECLKTYIWQKKNNNYIHTYILYVQNNKRPLNDNFALSIPSMEAASTIIRCISTGSEPKSKTTVWRKVPKISVLKPTATLYTQWSKPLSVATVITTKSNRNPLKFANHCR